MPLTGVQVYVTGLRATEVALHSAIIDLSRKAAVGLLVGGAAIRDQARSNMAPFRYRGRVQSKTTVGRPFFGPTFVNVTVGLHVGANAPEGRVFEFGWHSHTGKPPPVDKIALWLTTKPSLRISSNLFVSKRSRSGRVRTGHTRASISQEQAIRRAAFAIAKRYQRRPGPMIGEYKWLDDAARDKTPVVVAAVELALRTP